MFLKISNMLKFNIICMIFLNDKIKSLIYHVKFYFKTNLQNKITKYAPF
jgi:hypothetical protein